VLCLPTTVEMGGFPQLQFEAKAFQGPWDEEPVWKVYKVRLSPCNHVV